MTDNVMENTKWRFPLEMGRQVAVVFYVVAMVAVIVGVDFMYK